MYIHPLDTGQETKQVGAVFTYSLHSFLRYSEEFAAEFRQLRPDLTLKNSMCSCWRWGGVVKIGRMYPPARARPMEWRKRGKKHVGFDHSTVLLRSLKFVVGRVCSSHELSRLFQNIRECRIGVLAPVWGGFKTRGI